MSKKTPLHSRHQALGAKLVDFAGWEMPLQYGSQLEEHAAVRSKYGMFDVSHMRPVDISGDRATEYLRYLLANDVAKLKSDGHMLYTCLLTPQGGTIDDLIVCRRGSDNYRIVVNAGTTDKDLAWFQKHAEAYGVRVQAREDLGILAVQGPEARTIAAAQLPDDLAERALALKPFAAAWDDDIFVSRTGYTGEDGFELILPQDALTRMWDALAEAGVVPCGLGARDSLRLEAGLNLYGNDMDEDVSPLECGLAWTVAWAPEDRNFIGRDALEKQRDVTARVAIGVIFEGRSMLRAHMPVRDAEQKRVGEITSGGFSPTLKTSIGFARVAAHAEPPFEAEVRGRWSPLREARPPFVRNGKVLV
ncbi:MAG: glycine cleavage system aminomethyltransferase GcvT [Sinobacteraceae bacterium]|nr:glycine cleavage system aminomethyltransferase GcvT [Nevskiaceae bacterium]